MNLRGFVSSNYDGLFVGREREFNGLRSAFADVLSGLGRVVILAGEPGIGKTRTSQELAVHAHGLGARVLWGRCYEEQGAPPYWPWIQILRSYISSRDKDALISELGTGAPHVAEIVPELRSVLPELQYPSSLDPEYSRFLLFDHISSFIRKASENQKLVIVLDDLHFADRQSLMLLEFLGHAVQDAPILLLGTYRDTEVTSQHVLTHTLGELNRHPNFVRISLRGIDQHAVRRLVRGPLGDAPSEVLISQLHTRSQGNPLYLTEMVRLLANSHDNEDNSAIIAQTLETAVPAGVREVIQRRLNRLSDECNRTLAVASVIGRGFSLDLLDQVTEGVSRESLLASLEEAMATGIVEESSESVGRYQFTHVLIKDTIASGLSATRRAHLHGLVGNALESAKGFDFKARYTEIAHHFEEAAPITGSDKLVRYSLLAGEQALEAFAYWEALPHFERVIKAKGGQPVDEEMAAALFGLGQAQVATLQRHESQLAHENLNRAFDYFASQRDLSRAVAVAETYAEGISGVTNFDHLIPRALELVPPESHEAGRLLLRYVWMLGMHRADYEGAHEAFEKGMAIARREQDSRMEMEMYVNAAQVHFFHLYPRVSIAMSAKATEIARLVDDTLTEMRAYDFAVLSRLAIGELTDARIEATAALTLAERLRRRAELGNALEINAEGARLAGDWQNARVFSDRGLEIAPKFSLLLGSRALMEYETGNCDEGRKSLDGLTESMRLVPPGPNWESSIPSAVIPMIAFVTGDTSCLHVAEATIRNVLSSQRATPIHATTARTGLALIAVQRGDAKLAGELYETLKPLHGTMISWMKLCADRILALLAQTAGSVDTASIHFDKSVNFCQESGYLPELAWTCHDYANMLVQSDNAGDKHKAAALIKDALEITARLGMTPLQEKLVDLHGSITAPSERLTGYPDGLTEREIEVLRLVALGKSNREVASELYISINTVLRHMTHIFSKTGTNNRTEAATYAVQKGIT